MTHAPKIKTINVIGKDISICVTTLRRSCEHFMTIGATIDAGGYLCGTEMGIIVLAGKLAFVVGALGVYLMHYEEIL